MAVVRGFRDGDAAWLAAIANTAFSDEIMRGMPVFDEEYFVKRRDRPGVRLVVAEVDGFGATRRCPRRALRIPRSKGL